MRSLGIQPNIIVVRTEMPISEEMKDKIALFCDIDREAVIEEPDESNLYMIPLTLQKQKMDQIVLDHLRIQAPEADMTEWKKLVEKVNNLSKTTNIALVGKYVELQDAYLSVVEALKHAGFVFDTDIKINWVNAEMVTPENAREILGECDGIVVPGGFGERGVEGKSPPFNMPVKPKNRSSASASECSSHRWNLPAMFSATKMPTPRNLTKTRSIRSLICFPNKRMWKTSAEHCVSAVTRANS